MLKLIKKNLLVTLLIALPCIAGAETFTINNYDIVVPKPVNFVRADGSVPKVQQFVEAMVDPLNDTLAYYLSERDAQIAKTGVFPKLEQNFILKVNKQLKDVVMSQDDFAELQNVINTQNKEIFEKVNEMVPDIMGQTSANLSKQSNSQLKLSVGQMLPLKTHYQDANTLAYSMYINYGLKIEGDQEEFIVAATATMINVSGRILFLYSYGLQRDLEWTRLQSKAWADQILSQNPAAPEQGSHSKGFDWSSVIQKGIIGAIAGGLIGLLAMFALKKKED